MNYIVYSSSTIVQPMIFFFFFNDTATTEIYTLSLHDALPILPLRCRMFIPWVSNLSVLLICPIISFALRGCTSRGTQRSEEHTSELQSQSNLVCRLLLEKKKNNI